MAGLGSWGPYEETLPDVINAGCDVILFAPDPVAAVDYVTRAVNSGQISPARLEEALLRILGLKASLGLHKPQPAPLVRTEESWQARARAVTARAPVGKLRGRAGRVAGACDGAEAG
jgi:beta-N-acetylhexosaminidase